MKKFLTIMATTVLGTTTIANSNLLTNIQLNKKTITSVSKNIVKNNTNSFIQQVNGIQGKVSDLIATDVVAPNGTVYAGTYENGLYYSTDGTNFQQVNGIASSSSKIGTIVVAPNGTVYAGTDGNGLYYSTDGINFKLVNEIASSSGIETIVVAPNGTVYAGTDAGLYYSTNGTNFKQVNGVPNGDEIKDIVVAPNGTVYVGTVIGNGFLYYSTDGTNFIKTKLGTNDFIKFIVVAPNGTVYAGTQFESGLYYSTDGTNFKLAKGTPVSDNIEFYSVVVAPNGTVYAGTINGLYYSTDGINFKLADTGTNNNVVLSVVVAPNGTVYAGTDAGLYYSTDGTNFWLVKGTPVGDRTRFSLVVVAPNGTVYAGTYENGLYYSTDGINFKLVNEIANGDEIKDIVVAPNGTVYVGTYENGLYCINLKNKLFSLNSKPNYFLNNQFVFDEPTNISISDAYLQSASLDGKNLTLPSNNLKLDIGKHVLTLTLKDEYEQYAYLFDVDNNTGIITYNFWIKDTIDENNYSVNSDTTLYQGLVSNAGNTNGANIIQTEANSGSSHPAKLKITLQDTFLDLSKSYYVSGTVDTNNNFTATGTKVYLNQSGLDANNQFKLSTDGIYQLHLVDKVGNIQDTYLELGHSKDKDYDNWKLQGTFDDATFQSLAEELNVKPSVTGQDEAQQAMAWLNQYKSLADKTFTAEAKKYDAGFNITVADLSYSYKSFLDRTTVTDQGLTQKLNINELDSAIKEVVQNKINSGLNTVNDLTKKYNISTNKVIDSNSLNSYVSWINNYDSWFNKNETTILTNEINKVSHGYASQSEIKNILANINISNIFNSVNYSLQTSNNYQEFMNYQNLDQAILKADSSQTWEAQYQADLKIQESNLNLHGYTIAQILGNKQEPQTKSQMENYDNSGESFHTWLQTEANSKYHKYQLDTGLEIGLPLFVLVSLISLTWYYRHTKKYKIITLNKKVKEKD